VLTAEGITECYRYALRLTGGDAHLAEDLTQQVCEAAASRTDDGSAPITRGWMITAARRRFVDHLRRIYRDQRRHQQLTAVADTYDEPDWDAVAGGDALECLALLAPHHRAALVFRYLDDLSTAEVAELLERSVTATESLVARARRELARHVEERRHG
jgi:RNA polymerase sigma-70 factor (ECF subfamily)